MAGLRKILRLALGLALMGLPEALAKPTFISSDLEAPGAEILFCDLDGDHLKDVVLIDGLNLSIFYQDAKQGFARKPQQQFRFEERPSLVWPARLGQKAESLLVMTSDGVTELCFTNRTGQPARRQIIKQPTIVPESLDEPQVIYFPLSANTGSDWPLLLVPVADGLQVWQHGEEWRQAQFLAHAVGTHLLPSVANPGYNQMFELSLSPEDVNGDGRDDLMVMRYLPGMRQAYTLHRQRPEGLFNPEPVFTYTNKTDWRTSLCWVDLNRDGRLDLIKSTVSDEPFFVPMLRSGKVLVGLHLADQNGRIPDEPQQVFRKNDWSPALPVVDVDGDGFVDMVMGHIAISLREGFRKVITTEEIDFNLKFYFSRPHAGFPKEADYQRDVVLHLYHGFMPNMEHRLYYELFLNLNGDFNGDGKKDLLVRDYGGGISVYFFVSRAKGFSTQADLKFNCPEPIERWEVKDLNGDGVSDLIVKLGERNVFRIFTSQRP